MIQFWQKVPKNDPKFLKYPLFFPFISSMSVKNVNVSFGAKEDLSKLFGIICHWRANNYQQNLCCVFAISCVFLTIFKRLGENFNFFSLKNHFFIFSVKIKTSISIKLIIFLLLLLLIFLLLLPPPLLLHTFSFIKN